MPTLIPVFNGFIQHEQNQLVNARTLHKYLKIPTRFTHWIKKQIKEYQFIENKDFIIISNNIITKKGNKKKDYHITLNMAKELLMIEMTEKSKQVRKYFIDSENKLHQLQTNQSQTTKIRRYSVEVKLTDHFLNDATKTIKATTNDFNCLITGLAKELGFKINSISNITFN